LKTNKHVKQKSELVNISNSLANVSREHKCQYCDKVYKHKSSLCKHVKQSHDDKKSEYVQKQLTYDELKTEYEKLKQENIILSEKIKIYEKVIDSIS
jgi:uncharacterized C2H2 Zn-finger protein